MPIVTGKTVGKQNVAKAGSNIAFTSGAIPATSAAFTIQPLICPGLPKLTWIIDQAPGAGVLGGTFQPQIAIRRDTFNVTAQLTFQNMGPAVLLVPGIATIIEFNAPVEAIRGLVTPPGAPVAPATVFFNTLMFASG